MGVMAIKEHSKFPKAPGLEPDHQMQFRMIFRTAVGWGSYSSAKMQSAYSTAPADSVEIIFVTKFLNSRKRIDIDLTDEHNFSSDKSLQCPPRILKFTHLGNVHFGLFFII